jgi:hypothetical protein
VEGGSHIWVRGNGNVSLMLLGDNKVRERETLARIVGTIGIAIGSEGFKDGFLILQANTAAIVLNANPDVFVELGDFNVNFW